MRLAPCVLFAALLQVSPAIAQDRLPILDIHLHALAADQQGPPPLAMCTPMDPLPAWDPAAPYGETFMHMFKNPTCEDPVWSPMTDEEVMSRTLEVMERRNVIGVVSGLAEDVAAWRAEAPERLIPGLSFSPGQEGTSVEDLRRLHEAGQLAVMGEMTGQYAGIEPNDERMAPYWSLAEELDIPVGIHVGPGPPGVVYLGSPEYRGRMHSPLTMEEVLVRHPRLRVYLMHAGYPMLDDLLTLMFAHPQVYVDVSIIVYVIPRSAFYRYLERIVEAGFGNRVMFGSDQMVWPETLERAIEVIEEAPFLDEAQKRAILYDNAARFLRLTEEEIERHHRM